MIDYRKIWQSLNEDSKKNLQRPFVARLIPSKSTLSVFLATETQKNIRYLFVQLDMNDDYDLDVIPKFIGLDIEKVNMTLGSSKNQRFLMFRQHLPNTENIFEHVIADICDQVIEIENLEKLLKVLIKIMSDWKTFFEKRNTKALTIQQQKGLYAELYFLKTYLFNKLGYSRAIKSWTGAAKGNHDFQFNKSAVEVKATSSKKHHKFIVSSEKQLDDTGLDMLILALVNLGIYHNRRDLGLMSIVQEITSMIADDAAAYFLFELNLIKAGFNKDHASGYQNGFKIIRTDFFEVKEGFPRILSEDLPDGVGDLKYSVAVSSCNSFKRDEIIINRL